MSIEPELDERAKTMSDHDDLLQDLGYLAYKRDELDEERRAVADEIRAVVRKGREAGVPMTRMAETLRISRVALYKALE